MSQSIYVTLDTLRTETSVPAKKDKNDKVIRENQGSVAHTLPRENYPTADIYDNEADFLAWAQEKGALHSLLQAGLDKWLINDRATFKSMPKKGSWTAEHGQKAIDDRKWKVSERPESAKSAETKAEEAIDEMTTEEIKNMIAKMQAKIA